MQLMTWTLSRLGSRFNLLFEPNHKRVMHSALGRFCDEPMDLAVGLVEPDGTERVLPLTCQGTPLYNCEQFERFNSITYRGYSETYRLCFELNFHSVFYPQNEPLCTMPAFYLELRVSPASGVRWAKRKGPTPENVQLFIRINRPNTTITVEPVTGDGTHAAINLAYQAPRTPEHEFSAKAGALDQAQDSDATDKPDLEPGTEPLPIHERIVSLNPDARAEQDKRGLTLDLPVTGIGSGIKWRLVWCTHVPDPVLTVKSEGQNVPARFRYTDYWKSLDDVQAAAIDNRDEFLALSRRFEKIVEQAPIDTSQRHLLCQSFQAWASNCFWCTTMPEHDADAKPWFSVWEGSCFFHSTIDVEYNLSLIYFTIWPQLLKIQFPQWAEHTHTHEPSGGAWLSHDMGRGFLATGQAYHHHMEVEENCNFLLLLQAYVHWTGDKALAENHIDLIDQLATYLLWADRDESGFPSKGVANTIDDASPAVQYSQKQTYLAVKRLAALRAASEMLDFSSRPERAMKIQSRVDADLPKIEKAGWLGDHYAVCVDKSAVGVVDAWTGKPLPYEKMPGWDAFSIYTGNGLLLPEMIGQPPMLDLDRVDMDLANAMRENMSRYGDGHTSAEIENVWVSQNLWRDTLAIYRKIKPLSAQVYWDMQVMSNTGEQSLGFIDTYINNYLSFYPRGITSAGYLLAGPRLIIDRLAAGGAYITVDPDRTHPQRWPLLPLADWKAGKVPVCVVDADGRVTIEGQIDPVIVHGQSSPATADDDTGLGVIG